MAATGRGTNYVLTWNNYTQEQYDTLHVFITQRCKRGVIGKEVGASGTPHLQVAFVTKHRTTFNTLRTDLGEGYHIQSMREPWAANLLYCTKDDHNAYIFETASAVEKHQGARQDLIKAKAIIQKARSWSAVMDDDDIVHVVAKHGKWAEQIWANRPFPKMLEQTLRKWQFDLSAELTGKPDPRKIIWFYDLTGGTGKSYMSRYLCCNHGAIEMCNKSAETYFLYQGQPIVIWDLARTALDKVPYEAIEKVKNGAVVSTKYTPQQKIFDQPHVLCFANYEPNDLAWSKDRYDIRSTFDVTHELI